MSSISRSSLLISKTQNNLINYLFSFLPVSFIIGNLAVNINVILLVFVSLLFLKKKIYLNFKLIFFDKIILFFFLYIFLVLLISLIKINFVSNFKIDHFDNVNFFLTLKSFFFFRYIFLYFLIRILIENDLIDFKKFFLISSITCLFVSSDIIYQYLVGKDIFGLSPISPRKLSGPFGEELIAGGYLQRFFPFLICYLLIYYSSSKKYLFLTFFLTLIMISIILAGNRISLLLSILILFFYFFILEKKIKKIFLLILILFSFGFSILIKNNNEIKTNYSAFKNDIITIQSLILSKKIDRKKTIPYFNEFETFYDTWQLNKFFGGGIRSFRIFCPIRKNVDIGERRTCNTHPHNYYLEILAEIGLLGFILVITIFTIILIKSFFVIFKKNDEIFKSMHLPFLVLLVIEIFPFKNTGSFFSTWNTTFLFILMSCLIGLNEKYQNNYYNKL